MTRQDFEIALDAGKVKMRRPNGNLWMVKRNGRTQTWKESPNTFHVPIKIGFRTYGSVNQRNINSDELIIAD